MAESDEKSKRHFGLSRNITALSVLSLRKFVSSQEAEGNTAMLSWKGKVVKCKSALLLQL